nr:transcriptional regulatory protein dep1 [Quercus suber]
MAMSATTRVSTPRPSVSPLSTASRANPESPIAIKGSASLEQDALRDNAPNIVDSNNAEIGEEPDDRSSSLSDPEDEMEDDVRILGARGLLMGNRQLDSYRALDIDSEAETERLEDTPQKLRRHADSIGKTPSKLSQAATMDDDLSDPPSPLPTGIGAASSTSTGGDTIGKKRKRSDPAESPLTSAESNIGESPRKRSHEPTTRSGLLEDIDADDSNVDKSDEKGDTANDPPVVLVSKGAKGRRGGRPKGGRRRDVIDELAASVDETEGVEEEPSEEVAAKTEAEEQHKNEASTLFEELAKQFAALREKLYNERLGALTAELEMLEKPSSVHPEYLRQIACVNARLMKQTREANAFYHYKMLSIRDRTIGERSQLHSQYFQQVRQIREDVLDELGRDWYNIQQERRQSNQEKDEIHVFKFPEKKSIQLRQQAKYNQEVSVLSGMAKYVGFPAAPEIVGVQSDELEDDLRAMRVSVPVPQIMQTKPPTTMPVPRVGMQTVTSQSERLAHEQFIEQNAWARPQGSIHNYGTPGLTHTPDWAEPQNSSKNLLRNLNGHVNQALSPFATPVPQKRPQPEHFSSAGTVAVDSDGHELPSSVIAAPPTTDRVLQPANGDVFASSPLQVMKQRQQHPQHGGHELTGFRNAANMSTVSSAGIIDAPHNHERDRREAQHQYPSKDIPGFDAVRRVDDERREAYPPGMFRPAESYGTSAPLPGPT